MANNQLNCPRTGLPCEHLSDPSASNKADKFLAESAKAINNEQPDLCSQHCNVLGLGVAACGFWRYSNLPESSESHEHTTVSIGNDI